MNSYLPAGGYTLYIESEGGAAFVMEVPKDVAIAVESDAGAVPLPHPDPSVPRLYRGDVTLTFFRAATTGPTELPLDQAVLVAPVGMAVRDASVTIRKRP